MTSPKPLFTLLIIIGVVYLIAFVTQCASHSKADIIIRQNDKEIITKEYKTNVNLDKSLRTFNVSIDSAYFKHKPNQILYDGILVKAEHDPHKVIVRVTTTVKENNKIYHIKINKDVTKYFSCSQVEEFESKINKRIIITKTFYPKERIFYKFP